MCSSGRGLCGSGDERGPQRGGGGGSGSGSHYALCALGVGLVALGVVMIIWTVVPLDAAAHNGTAKPKPEPDEHEEEESESKMKTSSVAFVLVGSGVAMLLLAICLGIRNKHKMQRRAAQQPAATSQFMDHVHDDSSDEPPPNYNVPSYDEAVGSGQYPIRQSNLRNSTTHLPSYEDLIAAVENETDGTTEPGPGSTPPPPDTQAPPAASSGPAPSPAPATAAPPQRSSSRASRILRPLRVRRIKSEKLHLKDIRLNIHPPPAPGTVTIEPLTPPPGYEDKAPDF